MRKFWWLVIIVLAVGLVYFSLQPKPASTTATTTSTTTSSTLAVAKKIKVLTLYQGGEGESDLAAYVSRGLAWELKGLAIFQSIDVTDDTQVADYYGISSFPAIIFLSSAGAVLSKHEGYLSKDDVVARLKGLKPSSL